MHPFLEWVIVLGISGGQDSTLAGKLAQMAIDELNEEQDQKVYRFYAVRLPYGVQADEQDAMDAIAFMKATDVLRVNVKDAVDASERSIEALGMEISDFNKGISKRVNAWSLNMRLPAKRVVPLLEQTMRQNR